MQVICKDKLNLDGTITAQKSNDLHGNYLYFCLKYFEYTALKIIDFKKLFTYRIRRISMKEKEKDNQ